MKKQQNNQHSINLKSNNLEIAQQSIELENSVLGAILLDKKAIYSVIEFLKPHHFNQGENQKVYEAIITLFKLNKPIEILTVSHQLKIMKMLDAVGGPYYVTCLTNNIASSANIETHARIILQFYIERKVLEITQKYYITISGNHVGDSLELLEIFTKEIMELNNEIYGSAEKSNTNDANDWFIDLKNNLEKGITPGISTGYDELDDTTNKMQNGDLIVVAARPGMGKTSLVLCIAKFVAKVLKKPVAFFSMEMSFRKLMARLLSMEFNISSSVFLKNKYTVEELKMYKPFVDEILKYLIIDNTRAISTQKLKARATSLKHNHDIGLIIIDYIQLMTVDEYKTKGNRQEEVSTITRELKALAGIVNVPILALSQLSRETEKRGGDKKPQLSDLKESGSIEQDADMVWFIYRPEYYEKVDHSKPGLAEIIMGKNRDGKPLKNCALQFVGETTSFINPKWDTTTEEEQLDLFEVPDQPDDEPF